MNQYFKNMSELTNFNKSLKPHEYLITVLINMVAGFVLSLILPSFLVCAVFLFAFLILTYQRSNDTSLSPALKVVLVLAQLFFPIVGFLVALFLPSKS